VSRHWKPDSTRVRWTQVEHFAPPPSAKAWPRGATVGLLMIAAGCLAVAALLYRAAGPRVVVERSAALGSAARP
jgi:hypothetical protein